MAQKMNKVYGIVMDKIIEALENGVAPWRKPWKVQGGFHRNFNSKRPYTGVNQLLLQLSPFDQPFWNTYNGWLKAADLPARTKLLRDGESMWLVTFAKQVEKTDGSGDKYFMYRYYSVINYEQLRPEIQAKITLPTAAEVAEVDVIAAAEHIIENYVEGDAELTLDHGGDVASYSPSKHHIQLPNRNNFDSSESYYMTAFHECVHSTGPGLKRFSRDSIDAMFGNESYSKEELIAEIGAAFVATQTGIDIPVENSAAYLKGWATKLRQERNDEKGHKLIVQAASAAQKAADYIINEADYFANLDNETEAVAA